MVEILGIFSMLFIVIAFTRKNILHIRLLDMIGAAGFVVYGALTKTWSTVILNTVLIIVHTIYLIKLKTNKINSEEINK